MDWNVGCQKVRTAKRLTNIKTFTGLQDHFDDLLSQMSRYSENYFRQTKVSKVKAAQVNLKLGYSDE